MEMKMKIIAKGVKCALLSLGLAGLGTAQAADGWYVGGSAGQSNYDISADDFVPSPGLTASTSVDDGDSIWKLFGGYRRYLYQNRFGWLSTLAGLRPAGSAALGGLLPRRVEQALDAMGEADPALNHLEWSAVVGRPGTEAGAIRTARRLPSSATTFSENSRCGTPSSGTRRRSSA